MYDDIRSALETALNSIPDLPKIAWENSSFEPTTKTPWIKVRLLNTARRPATRGINPQMRYQGVLQLMLKFPENKGPAPSEDAVELILGHIEATNDLSFTNTDNETTYVTIDYVEKMGSYNETPWYTTPVNIGWHSFKGK